MLCLCPFLGIGFRKDVAAVDVGGLRFEERSTDAETEAAGTACDDDGFAGEGEEVEGGDVGVCCMDGIRQFGSRAG